MPTTVAPANPPETYDKWINNSDFILYRSPKFAGLSRIIIVDFEGCLVKKLAPGKIYHRIAPSQIQLHDQEFINALIKASRTASIIIMSNAGTNNRLAVDLIKQKFNQFIQLVNIPILAIFSLRNNRLSKPRTGMWRFIKNFYKNTKRTIDDVTLVGDCGGRIRQKTVKDEIRLIYDDSDIDRAMAHNCAIPYRTIAEFLGQVKSEQFSWSKDYLAVEKREKYLADMSAYPNPDILQRILDHVPIPQSFIIMIMGMPRSGKTRYGRNLMQELRKSRFNDDNAIEYLDQSIGHKRRINMTRKHVINRITVIVEGACHTDALREPYVALAERYSIPILYINIQPGQPMALLLNHIAVETANRSDIVPHPYRAYVLYKIELQLPENVIHIIPCIERSDTIMRFRP